MKIRTGKIISAFLAGTIPLGSVSFDVSAENSFIDGYSPCRYHYEQLLSQENGEGRQKFYQALTDSCRNFWESNKTLEPTDVSGTDFYVIDSFCLEDFGIMHSDAREVYRNFMYDNPIFYFADNAWYYTQYMGKNYFYLCAPEEYASASSRKTANAEIEDYIEDYSTCINGSSPYENAKAIHDKLILSMEYAYEPDGATPSEEPNAYTIFGAIEDGLGVCQSYALTYSMICNYYGIDNIFATGNAYNGFTAGGHAWNLIKLDDGNYYHADCTWDDHGTIVGYNYFAVGNDTMEADHIMDESEYYVMPEISDTDFVPGEYPAVTTVTTTAKSTTTTTATTAATTSETTTKSTAKSTTATTSETTTKSTTKSTATTTSETTTKSTTKPTTATTSKTTTKSTTKSTTTTTVTTTSVSPENDYTLGIYGDLAYRAYSDHVEITGQSRQFGDIEGAVNIPEKIDGLPVTVIARGAFKDCSGITSVTIPESVQEIRRDAFRNCENLKSVTIYNPNCEIYGEYTTFCNVATEFSAGIIMVSSDFTMYGYKNSTAEDFAQYYVDFVEIDSKPETTSTTTTNTTTTTTKQTTTTSKTTTTTTTAETKTLKGDANGDGKVSIADAVAILQFLANADEYALTEQGMKNADVVGDGDGVNTDDALLIQKFDAGTAEMI